MHHLLLRARNDYSNRIFNVTLRLLLSSRPNPPLITTYCGNVTQPLVVLHSYYIFLFSLSFSPELLHLRGRDKPINHAFPFLLFLSLYFFSLHGYNYTLSVAFGYSNLGHI